MSEQGDHKAWLAGLKAGDEVAIAHNFGRGYSLLKVERRTPSGQIVCEGVRRKFSADGLAIGDVGYSRRHLEPVTDKVRAAVQRAADDQAVYVAYRDRERATDEQLHAIAAAVRASGMLATGVANG